MKVASEPMHALNKPSEIPTVACVCDVHMSCVYHLNYDAPNRVLHAHTCMVLGKQLSPFFVPFFILFQPLAVEFAPRMQAKFVDGAFMGLGRTAQAPVQQSRLHSGRRSERSVAMQKICRSWKQAWEGGAVRLPPTLPSGPAMRQASRRISGSTCPLASLGLGARQAATLCSAELLNCVL